MDQPPEQPPVHRNRLAIQFTLRFALLALAPLAVALAIAYFDARSALTLELEEKLRGVAARQALVLTETIRARIGEAQVLASSPIVDQAIADPDALDAFTRYAQIFSDTRQVGRVYLVDRSGTIVGSAGYGPETSGSLRKGALRGSPMGLVFERAITVLEAEVSDFLPHPYTGKPAAFVAAPILRDGRLTGALLLQLDSVEQLGARPDYTGLGQSGETIILTAHEGEGDLVVVAPTRYDSEAAFHRRMAATSSPSPLRQAAFGGRGYGTFEDYRGVQCFGVWRYVPALRWGLVVKMDMREAFSPVVRLGQSFTIIFLATAFLIMVAVVITSRMVVNPIRRLRDAAAHMASVGLKQGTRMDLPSPSNEIGDLSQSLDTMASKLAAAFEDLEMANVTLEAKVEQRTDQLSAKNRELETALEELRSTQERMVAQAHMASLGQITKGVAHEIKNPLNFVNNFATLSKELCNELRDVIHDSPNVPEPLTTEADSLLGMMADNLQRIESHGRRADLIVSGMLEHSRGGSSQDARETDLAQTIRTSMEVAARTAQATQEDTEPKALLTPAQQTLFALEFDPTISDVVAYPGDLCRALINILSNAVWAVQQPGHTCAQYPPIQITTRKEGPRILVEIRDFGVGMDKATLDRAPHPFFTTKPTGEGTGLGLSLAYDVIVQLHKGEFEMTSQPGQGTTVRLYLRETVLAS